MKLVGIWHGYAADLDALEWLDQVSGNMFQFHGWRACLAATNTLKVTCITTLSVQAHDSTNFIFILITRIQYQVSLFATVNFKSNWVTMRKTWTFRRPQHYTSLYCFIANDVLFRIVNQQNNYYKKLYKLPRISEHFAKHVRVFSVHESHVYNIHKHRKKATWCCTFST